MDFQYVIQKGLMLGLDEIELYIETSEKNVIKLCDGKLFNYNLCQTVGVSIRGKYEGKMCYVYTESLKDSDIDDILNQLINNAKIITSTEEESITSKGLSYKEIKNIQSNYRSIAFTDKIQLLKKITNDALNGDERIVKVGMCLFKETTIKTQIINSKGLNLTRSESFVTTIIEVIANDGDDTKVGYSQDICRNFEDINTKRLVGEATSKALSCLGAGQLETGKYEAVFNHDVATSILTAFSTVFSGESALRKLTQLTDKVGQVVFGKNINIVDDPFSEYAIHLIPFDDEGIPCMTKHIIKNGLFNGFMHNSKTAKIFNTKSTGNGFKTSVKSSISTMPTNLYLVPGSKTEEELISSIDDGVYITDVSGLHSGVNTISGAFNLLASGFTIKNGRIDRPISLIVISGNFYEMMNNIEEVANNLDKIVSGVASPSIKITNLMVSCK